MWPQIALLIRSFLFLFMETLENSLSWSSLNKTNRNFFVSSSSIQAKIDFFYTNLSIYDTKGCLKTKLDCLTTELKIHSNRPSICIKLL